MSKARIVYISSLVILAVLVFFTIFRPMAVGNEYSEMQRVHLLRAENEWIIEVDVINREEEKQDYTITALVEGKQYTQDFTVLAGNVFTYIRHIQDEIKDNSVTLAIYKGQDIEPFKKVTYYLK